ncbi:MAG: hypothetical protein ACT4O0_05225 [Pseudonocardia sp.]
MTRHRTADTAAITEVPDVVARLAELVAQGKFAAARRAAASLIDQADPHALGVIARCAEALQADRHEATAALDELWLTASARDAAIITACLPGADYRPDLPTEPVEPAWKREVRWLPPSRVRVRRGPISAPARPEDSGVVLSYLAETHPAPGEVRDPGAERPIGYELDYDLAAVHPVRGTPCVGCWIERTRADQRPRQDDGLCGECRDAGSAGIPALPAGHTRADAVQARCRHIADTDTTGQGGLPALRAEYRRASAADRAVIAAWVNDHRA